MLPLPQTLSPSRRAPILLFSFEKMALRDAVKSPAGAGAFARGLYDLLHGAGDAGQTLRVLVRGACRAATAPDPRPHLARRHRVRISCPTENPFLLEAERDPKRLLAIPACHLPMYRAQNGTTYSELLALTRTVKRDLAAMRPRDPHRYSVVSVGPRFGRVSGLTARAFAPWLLHTIFVMPV